MFARKLVRSAFSFERRELVLFFCGGQVNSKSRRDFSLRLRRLRNLLEAGARSKQSRQCTQAIILRAEQ